MLGSFKVPLREESTNGESYATNYPDIVEEMLKSILQSGSPIVLFCLPYDIAESVVIAADNVQAVDTSSIIWVFSDYFVTHDIQKATIEEYMGIEAAYAVNGAIFLYPYQVQNEMMNSFLQLWNEVDPDIYKDADDDRSTIMYYSSFIVDSVMALSLAYQITLDENNYEDGSLFRERVFFNLVNGVGFDGLSGYKSFNSFGDLNHPVFSVLYVGPGGVFAEVGTINDTAVNVNETSFYWPDGSQGNLT